LSVTYDVSRNVFIPYAAFEMYYLATHPHLLQDPNRSPRDVMKEVHSTLDQVVKTQRDSEAFESALVGWWTAFSAARRAENTPPEVPEPIQVLIKELATQRKEIGEELTRRSRAATPVLEIHLPSALGPRFGLLRDRNN
jgi:hypothetical protein